MVEANFHTTSAICYYLQPAMMVSIFVRMVWVNTYHIVEQFINIFVSNSNLRRGGDV